MRNLLKLYVDIEFTGSHTQVSGTIIMYYTVYISRSVFLDLCAGSGFTCFRCRRSKSTICHLYHFLVSVVSFVVSTLKR